MWDSVCEQPDSCEGPSARPLRQGRRFWLAAIPPLVVAGSITLVLTGIGAGSSAPSGRGGAAGTSQLASAPAMRAGNPVAGGRAFRETCAACHGPDGQGQPHQGADLRNSRFVREHSDEALAAFVRTGRQPSDPRSVLGLTMPPIANGPLLDDAKLRDVIAFVRTLAAKSGG